MGRVLLLFTVLCSVLFAETAVDIEKKKIVLKNLDNCRRKKHMAMTWQNVTIKHDNVTDHNSMDLDVKLTKEVKDLAIVFNFWKCDASGNPDSCEVVLQDYNVSDICTHMLAKNEAWTVFMERFVVPPKCPIQPGTYSVRDSVISGEFLKYMPIGDALWKLRLVGYDQGVEVSCVELILQILSSYVKKRKS